MFPRIYPKARLTKKLIAMDNPDPKFINPTVVLTALITISSCLLSESCVGTAIESFKNLAGSWLAKVKNFWLNRTKSWSGVWLAEKLSGTEEFTYISKLKPSCLVWRTKC
jgi:hypothetical protein